MSEKLYAEEYTTYQLERSSFRRWVRNNLYFKNILRFVTGPTIDFGCGVGELLELLPKGSVGLEVNDSAVAYCRSRGLDVRLYDPELDAYQLNQLPANTFSTLVMAHVLEHLTESNEVIKQLLATGQRLGLERLIFVVPGVKGFKHDATHQTFLDPAYFKTHKIIDTQGYRIMHQAYFPVNSQAFSGLFTHNELVTVYERIN
jgi:SAM-dependent methyltransferase